VARREHKQRFWEAIAQGLSSEEAGVVAGVSPAVGVRWFRESGGMSPLTPAPPSGRCLSFAEREEIALLRARKCGVRDIARRLGRSPATISRELRRNAATRGGYMEYRATTAQWHADRRARRPKTAKLAANDALRDYVQDRLAGLITAPDGTPVPGPDVGWIGRRHGRRKDRRWAASWSPEQIANRLRLDFPEDVSMRISHEAIYQALYIQGRGALRRELTACLRTGRALRVPRARTRGRGKKFVNPEVMISQRPKPMTGQYPATGKATWSSGWKAPRSAPWSSAPPGSPCCCTCPAWKATVVLGCITVPRWPGTAPKRSAMPSRSRSPPCRSSCAGR
jgi:hypothetical protein